LCADAGWERRERQESLHELLLLRVPRHGRTGRARRRSDCAEPAARRDDHALRAQTDRPDAALYAQGAVRPGHHGHLRLSPNDSSAAAGQAHPAPEPMKPFAVIAAVLLVVPSLTSAHHSFAAEYDGEKPVTVSGIVAKIEWSNPHIHFYVDAKEAA